MAHFINAENLSEAWLQTARFLYQHTEKGKAPHVVTAFPSTGVEESTIRKSMDAFLDDAPEQPVETVANTLFPESLYLRGKPDARAHLYDMQGLLSEGQKILPANKKGTYFDRLVAFPGVNGMRVNQLERIILKLNNRKKNPKSSIYETSTDDPLDFAEGLDVYDPRQDNNHMGFPCLSHLSFTLHQDVLSVTALYRNQHFIRKAYGNYLGISRLLMFICSETGTKPGEVLSVATHADLELDAFSKKKIHYLLQRCEGHTLLEPA